MKRIHEDDTAPRSPLKPANTLPAHLLKKPRLGLSRSFAPPLSKTDNSKSTDKDTEKSADKASESESYVEHNYFQSSRSSEEICLCVEFLNGSGAPKTFGLLVIKFDEMTLFNMEGKQISKLGDVAREEPFNDPDDDDEDKPVKTSAAKLWMDGEPCPLAYLIKKKRVFFFPGNTTVFNSKTIHIRYRVPLDEYQTGSFFLNAPGEIEMKQKQIEKAISNGPRTFHNAAAVKEVKTFKSFAPPKKSDGSSSSMNIFQKRTEPLHRPGPGSVILFQPKDLISVNKIPVVVDPELSKSLRPHQVDGVRFMFECILGLRSFKGNGCILADDMGLGKTLQAIALIWTLLTQSPTGSPAVRRCVIVTPSSLVGNWVQEFKKWLPNDLDPIPMGDADRNKVKAALARFQSVTGGLRDSILVVSYDQLRIHVEEIKKIPHIDLVVCDEGHRLKNAAIKTSLAVNELETKRRLILSGTPIQNDLDEFFAMVNFVNPGILGTATTFRRVYAEHIEAMRQPECPPDLKAVGRERAIRLSQMTAEFILRRTSKVNQQYLPPKVDTLVFCKLTDLQRRLYVKISEDIKKSALNDGDSSARETSALSGITSLKKLCNAPHLIAKHELDLIRKLDEERVFKPEKFQPELSGKLQFIDRLCTEIKRTTKDKMVIVSNYTQTLNVLAMMCKARGFAFFQLDGKTKVSRRQELVNEFNEPSAPEFIFLLSSKAGGVGLNLIGANHLILVDPDWNPANDLQAMARVWRPGQKKKVFLYRTLATGTIEEKIFQRQVSKLSLASNVVGGDTDAKPDFTANEIRELFNYRADTLSDTHDLLNCRCSKALSKIPMHKRTAANVDELANWKHFDDFEKLDHYPVLQESSESLTFVFLKDDEDKEEEAAEADVEEVHIQQVEVNFGIGDGTQDNPIGEEIVLSARELDDDSIDGSQLIRKVERSKKELKEKPKEKEARKPKAKEQQKKEEEKKERVRPPPKEKSMNESVTKEKPTKPEKADEDAENADFILEVYVGDEAPMKAPSKKAVPSTPRKAAKVTEKDSQPATPSTASKEEVRPKRTRSMSASKGEAGNEKEKAKDDANSEDDFAPKKPPLSRSQSVSSQAQSASKAKPQRATPQKVQKPATVVIDLLDD